LIRSIILDRDLPAAVSYRAALVSHPTLRKKKSPGAPKVGVMLPKGERDGEGACGEGDAV
jgi:hypothetical protein